MRVLVLESSKEPSVFWDAEEEACAENMQVEMEPIFSSNFVAGKFVSMHKAKDKKTAKAEEKAFFELLHKADFKPIRKYLETHHLSESAEYQMIVTLGMMDKDLQAERIISGYIRCWGLGSDKSRQLLIQLNFQRALQTLLDRQEVDELADEEPTLAEKLYDGFNKFKDDDVLNGGFSPAYWDELLYEK